MKYVHETRLASATVALIRWEGDGTLSVSLQRGKTYRFVDVPLQTYFNFRNADSAGQFFLAHVNGVFEAVEDGRP